jgi:hypothetical protein
VEQLEKNIEYKSHQWVKLMWLLLPAATLLIVLFQTRNQESAQIVKSIALILSINLIALCLFGSFRIKLNADTLRWSFGMFGWPNWTLKVSEIGHAEVCHVLWFEGRGIRFTREGMLYNATGNGAVRITKSDGTKIRLGSAEPELLCVQIMAALNARNSSVTERS